MRREGAIRVGANFHRFARDNRPGSIVPCPFKFHNGVSMIVPRADRNEQFLPIHSRIRVKTGVTFPDVPEQEISGWEGTILKVVPTGEEPAYLVEWSQEVTETMSDEFLQFCSQRQLHYRMAFLSASEVERRNER